MSGLAQGMREPAFTCSVWPVIRPAPDEQKNAIACAMSSGWSTAPIGLAMPDLLRGVLQRLVARHEPARHRGVDEARVRPRSTVTPCSAPSSATVFVNAMSPPFDDA